VVCPDSSNETQTHEPRAHTRKAGLEAASGPVAWFGNFPALPRVALISPVCISPTDKKLGSYSIILLGHGIS
jgi:hypothetical protein